MRWRSSVKVGDLVKIRADVGLSASDWGKTAIVLKTYEYGGLSRSARGTPICDVHFVDNGELRMGMSQALFEILNESQ